MTTNSRPDGLPKRSPDLTGHVFGKLTVVSFAGLLPVASTSNRKTAHWVCRCECGSTVTMPANRMQTGNSKSCGCSRITHGKYRTGKGGTKHPERSSWMAMIERCTNPRHDRYEDYGGSGVRVCDRWMDFWKFMEDMGPRPSDGYSIDRYPDNDGNYEPGNCRWATQQQQMENRRNTRYLTHDGQRKTLTEWAEIYGVSHRLVRGRLSHGWSVADALSKPMESERLDHDGKTLTIQEWADAIGVRAGTIRRRLLAGWTVEKTLTSQLQQGKCGRQTDGRRDKQRLLPVVEASGDARDTVDGG